MNDADLNELHLKLDRMAREQIARGLRESRMTDAEQIAYAYVWHEYEGDVDLGIFRKVAEQLGCVPYTTTEKNEALEAWVECDVDPIHYLICKFFAPLEVDVDVVFGMVHQGDPTDVWFRVAGGSWKTLDQVDSEVADYHHAVRAHYDHHPSLSAEERNPSLAQHKG